MNSPAYYSLIVANAMTGEYFNSRLTALVRDKLGLTYGIESGLSFAQDFGEFTVNTSARNENLGFLLQKTIEVLESLKKDPITAEELQNAKNYVIGNFSVNHASLGALATRWLVGHLLGLGLDSVSGFGEKIQSVTLQQVQTAVQENFDLAHRVVVIQGDASAVKKALVAPKKKAIFGWKSPQVRVVTAKDLK
jgi:zinc protease